MTCKHGWDWRKYESCPLYADANSKPLGDVATRTIDGLLDVIEDMVRQFAAERDDGQIDSSAMGALADAMHVMHTAERLQITYAKGRRVIGKWASNDQGKGQTPQAAVPLDPPVGREGV